MINVVVTGACGRMGNAIIQLVLKDNDMKLVGCTERPDHPAIGTCIGDNIKIQSTLESVVEGADCIIDFTTPEAADVHLEVLNNIKCAYVIGTTGLNKTHEEKLKKLSDNIPIVYSANMSLGMNVMFKLVSDVANILREYEVEIIEAHHHNKVDAPSGSALKIGKIIASALNRDFDKVAVYGREGRIGQRSKEEIGIFAVRGGDIVGEHTAMFIGEGERIEITHRVQTRDTFAYGAIRAAKFVVNAKPGLYAMKDVLGI
jgi:4-hydroxy-tetrahydrodipicolinate reductase